MTFGSEEIEDRAALEGARRRLALALEEASPRVEVLLRRLTQADGQRWAEAVLERSLGRPEGFVGRVLRHRAAVAAAIAEDPDPPARRLAAAALDAAEVLGGMARQAGGEGADAPLDAEELLDLASELPDAWSDLLTQAVRQLRGDVPHDGLLPPATAESIGGYLLLEPLGHGAFGAVHRAIQPGLGRQVALKLLRPEVVSTQAEQRFLEEGRILSSLSHPGIASLYQAGFDRHMGVRRPFLAMELVQGRTILRFAREGDLDVPQRLRLLVQACRALQHAHERGVVHRDLHPGNLLVREDGTLKVVDFGAALTSARTHAAGLPLGALAYLAPEQASDPGMPVDARADVFSLGAVLFELLTGETPHDLEGRTPEEALAIVRAGTPRRLRQVEPRSSAALDAICARALAADPGERYASAREFAEDLRRHLDGLPVEAYPPGFWGSLALLTRRHRRETATVGLGAVAFVGLALATTVAWRDASAYAAELEATREQNVELVDDLLELTLEQADKRGSKWDSAPFYAEWRGRRDVLSQADHKVPRTKLLELLARHALEQDRFEQAVDLRREAAALLEEELAADPDDPSFARDLRRRLSFALVRWGDALLQGLGPVERLEADLPEVEGTVARARELYERALGLDQARAADGTDLHALDDLTWSRLRLFDLERRRGNRGVAWDHAERAAVLAEHLLALDGSRPHSSYVQAEILLRLSVEAQRSGDLHLAGWLTREAEQHAEHALAGEPERVPFQVALQAASRRRQQLEDATAPADAAAFASSPVAEPRLRRMAVCYAARRGRELSKVGDPGAAALLESAAVELFRPCVDLAEPELAWIDELQLARYLRRAARSRDAAGDRPVAAAFLAEAEVLHARVLEAAPAALLPAARALISHPHSADPCEVAQRLRAALGPPAADAARARLLALARLHCLP